MIREVLREARRQGWRAVLADAIALGMILTALLALTIAGSTFVA